MKKNDLIFTLGGHFEAFEVPHQEQKRSLIQAISNGGQIGILVGDIGVAEKLRVFRDHGKHGVIEMYKKRINCSKSQCVNLQLPSLSKLDSTIDWEILEELSNKETSNNVPLDLLAKKHLEYFKVTNEVRLLSERHFRNIASRRLSSIRGNRPSSWLKILRQLDSEDSFYLLRELEYGGGHVSCRAILLALIEYLGQQGFTSIHWVGEPKLIKALSTLKRFLIDLKTTKIPSIFSDIEFEFEIIDQDIYQFNLTREVHNAFSETR
jgi:hypothetical protein